MKFDLEYCKHFGKNSVYILLSKGIYAGVHISEPICSENWIVETPNEVSMSIQTLEGKNWIDTKSLNEMIDLIKMVIKEDN